MHTQPKLCKVWHSGRVIITRINQTPARNRRYLPHIYGKAITAVAEFLVKHGMGAAARPWTGAGYRQMGLDIDLSTGLTRPLPGFESEYNYQVDAPSKL